MRTFITLVMVIWMFPSSAQLFDESPGNHQRFAHVNLKQLRKDVLTQLMKDNLIQNRNKQVFLFLKDDGIELNRFKLPEGLESSYISLLQDHNLGTGPHRVVLINSDCTAVGDFYPDSFSGKSKGRLNLPEAWNAMEALE